MWQRAGIDPRVATSRFQPTFQGLQGITSPVIALGEPALNYMTGQSDLFRWRGRQIDTGSFIVYPTLDPSRMLPWMVDEDDDEEGTGLNHAPARFQGTWVWDVQQAMRQGLRPRPQPPMGQYAVDPPTHLWEQWVSELLIGPRLSFDIETAYKMSKMDDEEWEAQGLIEGQILRISFCAQPGRSVSVSWTAQYLPGIHRLLQSDLPKIVWNGAMFDVPKLESEGHTVNGRILDYQDAFKIVQSDLPKGLEYVTSYYTTFHPWKHLNSSNPGLYSCIDADAALQNAIGIDLDLERNHQTHLFDRHVTRLMPILKAAGRRGNLIDVEYSKNLETEMLVYKTQLEADVQAMVPEELKPRKRYKRKPEDVENPIPIEVLGEIKVCSHCQSPVSSWADHMKGRAKPTKKDPDTFNRCKAAGAQSVKRTGTVIEWDEILPWNPNSADQMKAYVRHFNHPMGKNRVTDQDSVGTKHLEKLVKQYGKKHPVYPLVADYKKVAKTISTYVYHTRMDSNNLIHSTYVNGPSTWRLAAKNENLTNVGKRESNKWAVRARRQIIARPGHVFVDADSTSIEAFIVGYLIGDENFMRMSGKSIHAWLACQELGWEFNDQTMERVKSEHKGLYSKMKTAIYLLLYGGNPYLMHMENPDNFPTLRDAKIIQDKIFNLVPKLAEWQERTRDRAKREGVLTSLWGYKHHFYDVYTFKKNKQGILLYDDNGKPIIKPGKDSKRALAFEPQNTAAAFGRDSLILIGESPWGQYMSANCFVHDGYTLEVPEELAQEAEQFLVDTLTRPVPQLGGHRIGCESGMGWNWAEVDPKNKFYADGNPRGMRTLRKVEC
jgi:DNA polymerase I-like protein with 3'-5' exonuclease and polymerase domains